MISKIRDNSVWFYLSLIGALLYLLHWMLSTSRVANTNTSNKIDALSKDYKQKAKSINEKSKKIVKSAAKSVKTQEHLYKKYKKIMVNIKGVERREKERINKSKAKHDTLCDIYGNALSTCKDTDKSK